MSPILIRNATTSDAQAIADIILPTIMEGSTYALDPKMSKSDALDYWMGPGKETLSPNATEPLLAHIICGQISRAVEVTFAIVAS